MAFVQDRDLEKISVNLVIILVNLVIISVYLVEIAHMKDRGFRISQRFSALKSFLINFINQLLFG